MRLIDLSLRVIRTSRSLLAALEERIAPPEAARESAAPQAPSGTRAAIAALRSALGPDVMQSGDEIVARYARTTLPEAPRPAGVVRPTSRDQVREAVRIAAAHGVSLHAISVGKNWGFGDACPWTEGQLVLDLSRLDRIVEVDRRLGYAVIEPGVTQGQLAAHLAEHAPDWWIDSTIAGPSTGILGNLLERGLGLHGCRYDELGSLEAVLADGTVFRSAPSTPGTRTGHVARWGLGPALAGLFTQSNLGVVTEATVWLIPRPERVAVFLASVDGAGGGALVDKLAPLRLRGVVPMNMHIYALPGRNGAPRWVAQGALYGTEASLPAFQLELEAALSGLARTVVFAPGSLDAAAAKQAMVDLDLPDLFTVFIDGADLVGAGLPIDNPPEMVRQLLGGGELQGISAPPRSSDPLDEGYGLYFVWSCAPSTAADFDAVTRLVASRMMARGFPPLMTMQLHSGRAMMLVTRIAFDKKRPDRCKAAADLEKELLSATIAAGYPPGRASLHGAGLMPPSPLARRIRQALDPAGVLAPGRYGLP